MLLTHFNVAALYEPFLHLHPINQYFPRSCICTDQSPTSLSEGSSLFHATFNRHCDTPSLPQIQRFCRGCGVLLLPPSPPPTHPFTHRCMHAHTHTHTNIHTNYLSLSLSCFGHQYSHSSIQRKKYLSLK